MGSIPTWWYVISTIAFLFGIVWLLVSAGVGIGLLRGILPLLTDSKNQVQDLGDLAAHTVGQAADTMDLVELRVSQAMGQATQAGASVTKQALGLGTVMAGLYMVSRVAAALRSQHRGSGRKRSRRR